MSKKPAVRRNPISVKHISSWTFQVFYYGILVKRFEGMNTTSQFKEELKKWGRLTGYDSEDVRQAYENLIGHAKQPLELNSAEMEERAEEMFAEATETAAAAA